MQTLENRELLGQWMEEKGLRTAAEIGVQQGVYSRTLLSKWSGHLTMVDAWCHFDSGYIDVANVSDEEHNKFKLSAEDAVREFKHRYSIIQGISPSIAFSFQDQSFDLIYLDANHSKAGCLADIQAWVPKVKKNGGVICGHDYIDETNCFGEFGVKSAVFEYFNREPDMITLEGFPSWFMFL
jgi:predicted O-methyltransferase YrrM